MPSSKSPPLATNVHTAVRLRPDEHAKVLAVIQQGLKIREKLSTSDVLRVSLMAFSTRSLSHEHMDALRAKDRRPLWRKLRR